MVTSTVNTGEQWDYPNGWAPLQWMAVIGLACYDQKGLAEEVVQRWLALNEKVFRQEGEMMEKYNGVDTTLVGGGGEYENQDGFGWTNGVAFGPAANKVKQQVISGVHRGATGTPTSLY